ncbi:MAG: hypothetical protein RI958_168 [Actinomycetota bacterium]
MTDARITVTTWIDTPDETEEVSRSYVEQSDGTWRDVEDPSSPPRTLAELVSVEPGEPLEVDTHDTLRPERVAAALPRSMDHLDTYCEIETGNDLLDTDVDGGGTPVVIDGERWALFAVGRDEPDGALWLRCDPEALDGSELRVVTRRTIAYASGMEEASMTAGHFGWEVAEVEDGIVAFLSSLDGEHACRIEPRDGRTDRQLALDLGTWIDWDPVAGALARAIELGGEYEGTADELDPEWSDSCVIRSVVDLADDTRRV